MAFNILCFLLNCLYWNVSYPYVTSLTGQPSFNAKRGHNAMGNLHIVQQAVQTSEDFVPELSHLLMLQSAAGHCLLDGNTVSGVTESPLSWSEALHFVTCFHKQVSLLIEYNMPPQLMCPLATSQQNCPGASAAQAQ